MLAPEIVDTLCPNDHAVQFYGLDAVALAQNVGRYLLNALRSGDNAVVICTAGNADAFKSYLADAGIDIRALGDRLQFSDADRMLDRFMRGGQPDAQRFNETVGAIVRQMTSAGVELSAYGEMVGLLWSRGQYPAAIRLEQLWHRLMSEVPFKLFCGYGIDLFDPACDVNLLDALLCAHSHLLPSGATEKLETALESATREVLGAMGERIVREARGFTRRGWSEMPQSESLILFLRKNVPGRAQEILSCAKHRYLSAEAM